MAPLGSYRTSRRAGAIVAVALHVAAAAALLSYEPARMALLAVESTSLTGRCIAPRIVGLLFKKVHVLFAVIF